MPPEATQSKKFYPSYCTSTHPSQHFSFHISSFFNFPISFASTPVFFAVTPPHGFFPHSPLFFTSQISSRTDNVLVLCLELWCPPLICLLPLLLEVVLLALPCLVFMIPLHAPPRVSHFHFLHFFASKQNEVKQKPFRFVFSSFCKPKFFYSFFSLQLFCFISLFVINFFHFVLFCFIFLLQIFSFSFGIKFTLVLTVIMNKTFVVVSKEIQIHIVGHS